MRLSREISAKTSSRRPASRRPASRRPASRRRVFRGISVSPGIAIGRVHLLEAHLSDVPKKSIIASEVRGEILRFQQALKKTKKDLMNLREKISQYEAGDQTDVIETHQMMAQDEMLIRKTIRMIRQQKINAEWALDNVVRELSRLFAGLKRPFREKYEELLKVTHRILHHLTNLETIRIARPKKGSVIVNHNISPIEVAQLVKAVVCGFLTEAGGTTSHMAIVARALEIPTVVGLDGIAKKLHEGEPILVDGTRGIAILNPDEKDMGQYRKIRKDRERAMRLAKKEVRHPAVTQDGFNLRIAANMELAEEISTVKEHGAEGVGLFRTEMFYLASTPPPTEDQQVEIYKKVLKKCLPHAVTFRTLDIGGDKVVVDIDSWQGINPALGLRAIRYGLKERETLRVQLRALLRASPHGRLKILIPMITSLDEIRHVKKLLGEIQGEMREKGVRFDPDFKLGVIIEVPSAALMASEIAQEVDFLSIGTNDLIQYTLAVDRSNEEVSYLYDPLHPAVLRLLKQVCDAARERNIEVSVCGEMAGNPLCFPILLGLGLSEVSLNPLSIPSVKRMTRAVTFRQANDLLEKALLCKTAGEAAQLVRREASRIDGFPALTARETPVIS